MAQDAVSRRGFAALLAAGLTCPALGRAGEVTHPFTASRLSGPEGYRPPDTMSAIRDLYRRMTVPVFVNGKGPFQFVVDTGSNRSVISIELARQLDLPAGDPTAVNGVAGVRMSQTTTAVLEIGARTMPDTPLMMFREDDIGGAGLLGLDDLDSQAVTLDFHRQTVRIEPGLKLQRDLDAVTLKAYRRDGQLLLVDADLDASRVIAFLDTGSDNTIGNLALKTKAWTGDVNHPRLMAPIVSATGQSIDGQIVELPRLRLGHLTISTWPVTFADLHTFEMWDLVKEPAMLLGVDVLSRFEYVCLDFARNEVRFRLPHEA